MGCLILLLVIALVLGTGMWLTVGVVGLIATLVVAGLVGWAADLLVPGVLPGGWIGAVLTGLIGGFVGNLVFRALGLHDPGFRLLGIDLIPAFVGALIIALAAELFTARRRIV